MRGTFVYLQLIVNRLIVFRCVFVENKLHHEDTTKTTHTGRCVERSREINRLFFALSTYVLGRDTRYGELLEFFTPNSTSLAIHWLLRVILIKLHHVTRALVPTQNTDPRALPSSILAKKGK